MSSMDHIVIVGAGLAGAHAAASLRANGFEGSITLPGEDPERPYSRPPLSKAYLRGEREREALYVHPEAFYAEHRIDLRPGTRVASIEPASSEVVLETGERLPADRILLATGATPRRLGIPGEELPGVVNLRTLADGDALRAQLADAERIVVVGAGWIGSEVGASLRKLGRNVTLVGPRSSPLEAVVGPEIGSIFAELHREHGVDLRLGAGVTRILGRGRVEGVELSSSEQVPADLVVVAVGVAPRTELAGAAGLAVGNGIEVSPTLETSVPGIFAVGDVASLWHPFYQQRIRTEHSSNARLQGTAVAPLMLGTGRPFDGIPSFFSEQHGLRIEYTGHAGLSDPMVVRGSLADRSFIAFRLVDGRVAAAITVGVPDTGKPIEELIRTRAVIEPARLADPSIALDALAATIPADVSPAG